MQARYFDTDRLSLPGSSQSLYYKEREVYQLVGLRGEMYHICYIYIRFCCEYKVIRHNGRSWREEVGFSPARKATDC